MPIIVGTSNKNQKAIAYEGTQMVKAYFDGKMVWQKNLITNVNLGLIYNPYVIFDTRNILSPEWHIANMSEYNDLISYSGDSTTIANKCKDLNAGWIGTMITNEFKLNLRKSGSRDEYGNFSTGTCRVIGKWFSSPNTAGFILATDSNARFSTGFVPEGDKRGFSVRAIKDSTLLNHGQSGVYQGNDGKIYRSICIGTQEWLADNLAETKFRTGEVIPEITSNAAWAAQTTSALCALNNDWNNVLT